MTVLKAEGIKKIFDQRMVLSDVNLSLNKGEIYTLFGTNGSGKTTFTLILSSLLKPIEGEVTFEGKNIYKRDTDYRMKVGLLTHNTFLYENLTGHENLRFFGGLYGIYNLRERIEELSNLFNIEERMSEPVRNLSRGMKQRLSIIRALIHDPEIILLDEPYTGLDEVSTQTMENYLLSLQKKGKIIFITTHNLIRGYRIATQLGILSGGKIHFKSQKKKITSKDLEETYRRLIYNETL
ncbi:ABC transporter ATP-binding protein [candidate division WOR-3 bacterium]|nr:ABC transporter ATP-binding protein [candidate division WOR-3 bacterium]